MRDIAVIRCHMEEARAYTLSLIAQVDDRDFCRQLHKDFSPLGWHLGHIGVTESYWILQQCKGEPALSASYDRFFTPTENPKLHRVNLPARAEILAYLQIVREQVFAFLDEVECQSSHPLLREANIFSMLLQHEEQHTETMLLILHLLAADRSAKDPEEYGRGEQHLHEPPQEHMSPATLDDDMVLIPDGSFLMGSNQLGSTLDNERPQHEVWVPDFLIDRSPITNQQFLGFIEDGGYHTRSWWSPEGWHWREQNASGHPVYWRRQPGGEWLEVGLSQTRPLALAHPVMCVSWYEADAYARYAGKRLPTEAEWEKAASWDGTTGEKYTYPWGDYSPNTHHCNGNTENNGTTAVGHYPAGRSLAGCEDLLGNVWEWTATWFHPYPGFVAHPYEGYSVPYFDQQHRVLRGGSWATRRHVMRSTFRNWYPPWVREIFAGFRCAKDV